MKRNKKKSVQALLEHSFEPLERTKEGLLLGGFAEISAYGTDNCKCGNQWGTSNDCQCIGNNCTCANEYGASNNCMCEASTTQKPTQVGPTTCGLFF